MEAPVAFAVVISGNVQGVGFRFAARKKATECGVCGFIRNEPDGAVRIEAEGNGEGVREFIEWCKKGPPGSRIARVEITPRSLGGFHLFEIR